MVAAPPAAAAWRHRDARSGFEVAFFAPAQAGWRIEGRVTGVEDGAPWAVAYEIDVDDDWITREAHVRVRTAQGARATLLAHDGAGNWLVDGFPATHLAGCLDVDLEASAMTNALPARRLSLETGEVAEAPAAWVRAHDAGVERLEQRYVRIADDAGRRAFAYAAPDLDVTSRLVYDAAGLVIDYPGIAERVA